jgi:hypothetical protein
MAASTKIDHKAALKAKGWSKTTVTVFGIPEERWVSPTNGRAYRLAGALQAQKRKEIKPKKKAR